MRQSFLFKTAFPPGPPASRAVMLTAIVLLLMQGCRSASSESKTSRIHVALDPNGEVVFNNRTIPLKNLPAELRRAGVGTGSAIVVTIPQDTSKEAAAEIINTLRAANFNKVLLTKPRQVSAFTADKAPTRSSPNAQVR